MKLMNKQLSILAGLVILLFAINFVSAGFFSYLSDYDTNTYSNIEEYKRTTKSSTGDWWDRETKETTVYEKTETKRTKKTPRYRYYGHYPKYGYGVHFIDDRHSYSNWRYKEPYKHYKYDCDKYRKKKDRDKCKRYNYYYKPRYDHDKGYYDWRW